MLCLTLPAGAWNTPAMRRGGDGPRRALRRIPGNRRSHPLRTGLPQGLSLSVSCEVGSPFRGIGRRIGGLILSGGFRISCLARPGQNRRGQPGTSKTLCASNAEADSSPLGREPGNPRGCCGRNGRPRPSRPSPYFCFAITRSLIFSYTACGRIPFCTSSSFR